MSKPHDESMSESHAALDQLEARVRFLESYLGLRIAKTEHEQEELTASLLQPGALQFEHASEVTVTTPGIVNILWAGEKTARGGDQARDFYRQVFDNWPGFWNGRHEGFRQRTARAFRIGLNIPAIPDENGPTHVGIATGEFDGTHDYRQITLVRPPHYRIYSARLGSAPPGLINPFPQTPEAITESCRLAHDWKNEDGFVTGFPTFSGTRGPFNTPGHHLIVKLRASACEIVSSSDSDPAITFEYWDRLHASACLYATYNRYGGGFRNLRNQIVLLKADAAITVQMHKESWAVLGTSSDLRILKGAVVNRFWDAPQPPNPITPPTPGVVGVDVSQVGAGDATTNSHVRIQV